MPDDKKSTQDESTSKYVIDGDVIGSAIGANAIVKAVRFTDRQSLRKWWHGILGDNGRYNCYAIFLVLPSDKEAVKYFTEYGKELDLISGENCLVIALSKDQFMRTGFDEGEWVLLAQEHSEDGHSVKIAQLFDIDFTKFPSLIIFQDIRSQNHVAIPLGGMTADEISKKMRSVFSIVQEATKNEENPLIALEEHQNFEAVRKTGRTVASKAGAFAEKTFEAAMEAWLKATIK